MMLRYAHPLVTKEPPQRSIHNKQLSMPCIKSCRDVPDLVQLHIQFSRNILIAMAMTSRYICGIHMALLPDLAVGFKLCGKQVNFPIYFK